MAGSGRWSDTRGRSAGGGRWSAADYVLGGCAGTGEAVEVHAWEDDGPDGPGSGRILFQTRVGDRVVFDAGVMTRRA